MSTSAGAPSQSQPGLFVLNDKLVPVISAFLALVFIAIACWCILASIKQRKLRRIANDPRTLALARERARLKAEAEKGPPTPIIMSVNIPMDLKWGEQGHGDWCHVMPLGLEFQRHHPVLPPVYSEPVHPTEKDLVDAKFVRLTILVALPSELRKQYRKNDALPEATLQESQGKSIEAVDPIQDQFEYQQCPEAAIGIYQGVYKHVVR